MHASTSFRVEVQGPRFTNIRKSYEFVTPIVKHRRNEFVKQKTSARTLAKRAKGVVVGHTLRYSVCIRSHDESIPQL